MLFLLTGSYYLLFAINFILSISNKKSKAIIILTTVLCMVLFSTSAAIGDDALIYKKDFEEERMEFELGYVLFKKFFYFLNIHSYNFFCAGIFIFSSILMSRGLNYFNINYHVLFSIIMPYIIPLFTTTIRFYLAFSIFVFFLPFLLEGKQVIYFIGSVTAGLFHNSFFFVIIFVLCNPQKIINILHEKKLRRFLLKTLLSLSLVLAIVSYAQKGTLLSSIVSIIVNNFLPDLQNKFEAYFTTSTHLGALIFIGIYAIGILFSLSIFKFAGLTDDPVLKFNNDSNILMAVILPVLVLNLVFGRLLTICALLNGISFTILTKKQSDMLISQRFTIFMNKYSFVYFLYITVWYFPSLLGIANISVRNMISSSFLIY